MILRRVLVVIALAVVASTATGAVCDDPTTAPYLVLVTDAGTIAIELLPGAAPRTVERLVALARGPVFDAGTVGSADGVGYFDGLEFDYARPHLEISLSSRVPERLFTFPVEIDGRALGLDEDLVADAGEAMDIAQMELAAAAMRLKSKGGAQGRLKEWMDELRRTGQADFLVGVSRLEINQALGYVYTDGLASRPALAGAVVLRPVDTTTASARLTILLDDYPRRTGQWMVVGRVVEGLELAREISVRPLFGPQGWRDRSYTPRDPVRIITAGVECRPRAEGASNEEE